MPPALLPPGMHLPPHHMYMTHTNPAKLPPKPAPIANAKQGFFWQWFYSCSVNRRGKYHVGCYTTRGETRVVPQPHRCPDRPVRRPTPTGTRTAVTAVDSRRPSRDDAGRRKRSWNPSRTPQPGPGSVWTEGPHDPPAQLLLPLTAGDIRLQGRPQRCCWRSRPRPQH